MTRAAPPPAPPQRTPPAYPPSWFDPACRRCPRLAGFLSEVAAAHPGYHAAPVPPFGPADADLLIVGLAPGLHGANRTGRPFTGDYAGELLYATLHELGLGSRPAAVAADDGLELRGCRISNAVKCVPPANKPVGAEVAACSAFLGAELADHPPGGVVLALGQIAHRAVIRCEGLRQAAHPFGHARVWPLPRGRWLIDSYHCSRYNTQTGRLSPGMFRAVFRQALELRARSTDV